MKKIALCFFDILLPLCLDIGGLLLLFSPQWFLHSSQLVNVCPDFIHLVRLPLIFGHRIDVRSNVCDEKAVYWQDNYDNVRVTIVPERQYR